MHLARKELIDEMFLSDNTGGDYHIILVLFHFLAMISWIKACSITLAQCTPVRLDTFPGCVSMHVWLTVNPLSCPCQNFIHNVFDFQTSNCIKSCLYYLNDDETDFNVFSEGALSRIKSQYSLIETWNSVSKSPYIVTNSTIENYLPILVWKWISQHCHLLIFN